MTASLSDSGLAQAFANGDGDAGDALFARHAASLRAFLTARCRDPEQAAELLQEVALRFVTARPRLDPSRDVRAYLFQAAANVWRDQVRKALVERRAAPHLVARGTATPTDARLLAAELRTVVQRAIADLPAAQRQVLELRHTSSLTFREIAARLGRPLGTVLTQMRAALRKVEAALESYR
jgi:RNA polymerase sigma-70 factor (ECF subfamily)